MGGKPVVGFVGVGLMGWGMARNAVEKGWPLCVVAHRKREAIDDLVARGARECADLVAFMASPRAAYITGTVTPAEARKWRWVAFQIAPNPQGQGYFPWERINA